MNVGQLWILERSLQFSADNILEAVIGNDMVVGALILYRNGLFHQPALLEFVAINEGSTEAPLLIWCEALGKVGIDLACSVCIANKRSVKCWVFVFILGSGDVFSILCERWACTLLALALGTTRWIQRRLLLLWLQSSYKLAVNQAIVHNPTWRPVHRVSPTFDARSVFFVDKNRA